MYVPHLPIVRAHPAHAPILLQAPRLGWAVHNDADTESQIAHRVAGPINAAAASLSNPTPSPRRPCAVTLARAPIHTALAALTFLDPIAPLLGVAEPLSGLPPPPPPRPRELRCLRGRRCMSLSPLYVSQTQPRPGCGPLPASRQVRLRLWPLIGLAAPRAVQVLHKLWQPLSRIDL